MAYADYDFYVSVYKGTMTEAAFGRLSERASDYIDSVTDYAFTGGFPSEQTAVRVKKAVCAVADVYGNTEKVGVKKSESVDGYSVSYAAGAEENSRQLADIVKIYLSGYVRTVGWI